MKTKVLFPVLLVLAAVTPLMTCNTIAPEVTMAFSDSQNGLAKSTWADGSSQWVFPLKFAWPPPATGDQVSTGHINGATVISITATSNTPFYITGVRIEQVLYRPTGASSEIGYVNPNLGLINPFFLELPGGPVITVASDKSAAVFDVDLATALSLWTSIDADNDGTPFSADQNEVISVACSLFFEGYMKDGTEFSGQFPPPLRLYFRIQHT